MKYFISEKFGQVYFIEGNDMFGIPIRSDNTLDDDEYDFEKED